MKRTEKEAVLCAWRPCHPAEATRALPRRSVRSGLVRVVAWEMEMGNRPTVPLEEAAHGAAKFERWLLPQLRFWHLAIGQGQLDAIRRNPTKSHKQRVASGNHNNSEG